MKLLIINGSPRGVKSNSLIIAEKFNEGFKESAKTSADIRTLAKKSDLGKIENTILEYDTILMIFPLYTDCMPAIVLNFLNLAGDNNWFDSKNVGYFVQSGFPESKQSKSLVRYLEKFTKRVEANYIGSIIKGGVEGIQIMPPRMTKKFFKRLVSLGNYFAEHKSFDKTIVKTFSEPYKLSYGRRLFFKLMQKLGFANFYWNMNLKKNNATQLRDQAPFATLVD
ncbi:MAG: hypothetical protein C0596_03295 [Marinilabiliales bacterium]|nr:MAG: hypothetical protein C0596_03295 [Marinilabiliales bacterium]